jgi:hypothetical protein
MTDVETEIRGRRRSKRVPEGEYLLKIMEGSWQDGDKADYINWRFQILKGVSGKKYAGGTLYTITSLAPKALFNLRSLIYAAKNKNMAGKAFNFDPETLVGITVGATVEDDEYTRDGTTTIRSRPVDFYPKEKFEEATVEEEDDDEDEDVEEEVSDDDEEELEDVDVDEL